MVLYKHVPAICSKSSLRCGFSAAIGFRWAVSSKVSSGRAQGKLRKFNGFLQLIRHPGYSTLSDADTVQDGVKQVKEIIVLACRKIFPIENHEVTLR